jgi:hypothetical protein
MSGAGVRAAGLGVAIVETAPRIEMGSRGNHVHAFWLALDRDARCPVVAVTHSGRNRDAVDLVTACCDRQRIHRGAEVGTIRARSFEVSAGGHGEVVVLGRLIVKSSALFERVIEIEPVAHSQHPQAKRASLPSLTIGSLSKKWVTSRREGGPFCRQRYSFVESTMNCPAGPSGFAVQ